MRTDYNNSKKTGGIYAAIILCLAAVLVLTYFSARSIFDQIPDDEWTNAADSAASDLKQDNSSDDTLLPTVKPKEDVTVSSSKATENSSSSESEDTKAASATIDKTKVSYQKPLLGQTLLKFSSDTPVFSKTMEDWRVHTGIDIEGDLGDAVKAAADGTVEDVYTDELKGVTVIIDHADSVKTLYCGLDEQVNVKVGAKVLAGDIIGKIGDTNELECLDASHLHFEMVKNGVYLNPEEMIS